MFVKFVAEQEDSSGIALLCEATLLEHPKEYPSRHGTAEEKDKVGPLKPQCWKSMNAGLATLEYVAYMSTTIHVQLPLALPEINGEPRRAPWHAQSSCKFFCFASVIVKKLFSEDQPPSSHQSRDMHYRTRSQGL